MTKRHCTVMNQSAARVVRRKTKPDISDPRATPTRMTVSSSENTARKPPSRMHKWRNHTISIPIAANPDIARATPLHATARDDEWLLTGGEETSTAGTTRRLRVTAASGVGRARRETRNATSAAATLK